MTPDQFNYAPHPKESNEAPGFPFKKVAIVRHGDYGPGPEYRMSERGRTQMVALGETVNKIALEEDLSILILSSSAPRASDCAEVLSKVTGAAFERHEVLWSDVKHHENYPAVMELIDSKKGGANFLIILTHMEYTMGLPFHLGRRLGQELRFEEIGKGEALLIDCEQKNTTVLKPQT